MCCRAINGWDRLDPDARGGVQKSGPGDNSRPLIARPSDQRGQGKIERSGREIGLEELGYNKMPSSTRLCSGPDPRTP